MTETKEETDEISMMTQNNDNEKPPSEPPSLVQVEDDDIDNDGGDKEKKEEDHDSEEEQQEQEGECEAVPKTDGEEQSATKEVEHEEATEAVTNADADAVESAPQITQTRFNFYDPTEFQKSKKASDEQSVETTSPKRFHFYNPEEVASVVTTRSAPGVLEQPSMSSQLQIQQRHQDSIESRPPIIIPRPIIPNANNTSTNKTTAKNATNRTQGPSTVVAESIDSQDILASLQATERLVANGGSTGDDGVAKNPYEAAIQDALAQLKLKATVHQQQHQYYANYEEPSQLRWNQNHHHHRHRETERPGHIFRTAPQNPRTAATADEEASVASATTVEEEVQRGVERVLKAILQSAQSGDEDAVSVALESLKGNSSSNNGAVGSRLEPSRSVEHAPSGRVKAEFMSDDDDDDVEDDTDSDDLPQKSSVVDELLAEEEDHSHDEDEEMNDEEIVRDLKAAESKASLPSEIEEDPILGNRGLDDDESDLDDDDEDETPQMTEGLLGPLGGQNTTGVVLEREETEEEDETAEKSESTSLIDTLVKETESFVSYMTSAINLDDTTAAAISTAAVGAAAPKAAATTNAVPVNDRYATQAEVDHKDDDSYDSEANELMRSLCAHLLPYGVDKSTKHLTEIPPWDDHNPNEPGYRIIRLSKMQLQRVEKEFQRMVNSVKQHSLLAHRDGDFDERDLQEAEDLLEREEKRQEAVTRSKELKHLGGKRQSLDTETTNNDDEDDDDDESDETSDDGEEDEEDEEDMLDHHPDFPGVKASGHGEMGDLEYFSLPIIYKSNVTGFEPTKDMFLEPGNVVAGQYLVENELGSAAFSTAYRCIDLNSDATGTGEYHEEVCLKVIKNTKDFFDQSLDEIKILELLRQTGQCGENNIVEMRTFFYHREHLIIVTELLRQNLFEFGKFIIDNNEERYFTRRRLCYITRQVLVALDFVHSLKLVHSDVKPENILLASYSRAKVKLIDFGSSCYLTDRQSSYIQSRSYRAPEVILGLPYDGKIDVWSLGCVVCEMYTGEVTFQNDSIVSMLSRIEAICGPFPRHMIAQGRQSGRFFTKSGLLYEVVDGNEDQRSNPLQDNDNNGASDDNDAGLFDVFQPKRTTLAARLGYDPHVLKARLTPESEDQALFVDFCQSLLTIDPDSRPTAAQALQHPWIVSGESLTEEDIKYPSG